MDEFILLLTDVAATGVASAPGITKKDARVRKAAESCIVWDEINGELD